MIGMKRSFFMKRVGVSINTTNYEITRFQKPPLFRGFLGEKISSF
ncbi:hypothetical protein C943_00422 [Mariniradius saccharolyticus AK6]|uniref:Uncharacterized protein n=1 Tax=Mariniradius saccharolyticus AK6 TaxID=1239962 RepID=M7X6S5_9BACT|nr:hypothetical protein C943_00422 [Mariniradius saccharolyticus AK6]